MFNQPTDRVTKSNDKGHESQKDPFGFDLAARCFTEQVRDSMAKISTGNVNAKTTPMLEGAKEKEPPKDNDAALAATLKLLHDPKENEKLGLVPSAESRQIAEDKTIGKILNPKPQHDPWSFEYKVA